MFTRLKAIKLSISILILLLSAIAPAQNTKADKMAQLDFLVGEWVGTSRIYENGEVTKQYPAYEKISYDLEKHILVIELKSEFLQLRTIINYNEEDQTYYYNRFSKDGSARYPAELKNGQLVVSKDSKTRYYFGRSTDGDFREYGEKMINGKWVRTFEDRFKNME